jgi:ABC-type multidrug transport system permease subunit
MKQIQPVSIWYNGQMIQATIFNMNSIGDDLSTTAIFYYQLFSSTNIQLAQGNLTMTGFDYEAYSTSPDSNAYAYQWGATQLNLTLV